MTLLVCWLFNVKLQNKTLSHSRCSIFLLIVLSVLQTNGKYVSIRGACIKVDTVNSVYFLQLSYLQLNFFILTWVTRRSEGQQGI